MLQISAVLYYSLFYFIQSNILEQNLISCMFSSFYHVLSSSTIFVSWHVDSGALRVSGVFTHNFKPQNRLCCLEITGHLSLQIPGRPFSMRPCNRLDRWNDGTPNQAFWLCGGDRGDVQSLHRLYSDCWNYTLRYPVIGDFWPGLLVVVVLKRLIDCLPRR
jgi:hypothetical protein